MVITSIAQAEEALGQFRPRRQLQERYNLDTMRALLAYLDNPQEKFRAIHVAGTSGKTSTTYFIRGLLQAADRRTGLTVSPHIASVTERVQVNGAPLDNQKFVAHLNDFLPLIAASNLEPSYFEVIIAFAYWVFVKEKVEFAVIETGLGGLLDSTNTVNRSDKLCVITDIGLDHTEILGETIPLIAEQKAGIIQYGNTVVMLQQSDEIMQIVQHRTSKKSATLHIAKLLAPPELPPFQQRNWSVALAAYQALDLPNLPQNILQNVMAQTPPGRLETYTIAGKTIILDGAHNPQKLTALRDALRAKSIVKTAVMANFVSAPHSKITAATEVLADFASHVVIPEFTIKQDFYNRNCLPAADLATFLQSHDVTTQIAPDVAKALAILLARPEDTVVITGSLYLVSAVRPLLAKKQ